MLYGNDNRGIIQHAEQAKQIVRFTDLRFKDITPTDIDCSVEVKNTGYIICEFKYGSSRVPHGQYLCLKRMCDDFEAANKISILLICEHQAEEGEDILAKDTIVREMYYQHKIYPQYAGMTLKEVWEKVISKIYKEWKDEITPDWLKEDESA